jgi:sugar lactone lactonase YvrE
MTADVTSIPAGGRPEVEPAEDPRRRRRKEAVLGILILMLALLAGTAFWYLIFRQPIIPLPPIPVSQLPTYSTSLYGSTHPIGIAVSASGDRIYVIQGAATGEGVVFDDRGSVIGTFAPPVSDVGHQPSYAAVDPTSGELYVSDRLAGAVYVYDRDGAYQRELRLIEPRPGWQPMGLAFNAAGNLFVTDLSGPFILEIDRTGTVVRTLGQGDQLSFPNGVAVDRDGNVYVTDSNNGRLLVYGTDGKVMARVGRGAGAGALGLPRGLSIDTNGRVFITDTTAQGVFVYGRPVRATSAPVVGQPIRWYGGRTVVIPPGQSSEWGGQAQPAGLAPMQYLGFFGEPGISDAQFQFPNGMAVDGRGRVYVADTFNNRVQIWSY